MSRRKRAYAPSDKPLMGSYEATTDHRWTTSKAEANRRGTPSDTGAGAYDKQVRISPENLRRAFEDGVCPWCSRGPFKNIAAHTNQAHGIDRLELRELAKVNRTASICSPGLSETARRNATERLRDPDFYEQFQRASAANRDKAISAAKEARTKGRLDIWKSVLGDHAKGIPRAEIAEKHGITEKTLRDILQRYDAWEDGRATTGPLAPSRAGQVEKMRVAAKRNQESRRQKRIARFRDLGGDWDALVQCAAEFGTSPKNFRDFLAKHIDNPPDGRVAKAGCMTPEFKKKFDRYMELGTGHNALLQVAEEFGLKYHQGLKEKLRDFGAPVEDGRKSRNTTEGAEQ